MDKITKKARELANVSLLLLISRIGVPILVAICSWIASNVVDLKVAMGQVQASVVGYETRISGLEHWRLASETGNRER